MHIKFYLLFSICQTFKQYATAIFTLFTCTVFKTQIDHNFFIIVHHISSQLFNTLIKYSYIS